MTQETVNQTICCQYKLSKQLVDWYGRVRNPLASDIRPATRNGRNFIPNTQQAAGDFEPCNQTTLLTMMAVNAQQGIN